MFELKKYIEPVFPEDSPDAGFVKCEKDGVAPDGFHAMSIYPEYFRRNGVWLLAEESRMDCVAVLAGDRIEVVEFRNLKKGDLVAVGRTENGEEGIFVNFNAFEENGDSPEDQFAFRKNRSRETAFSADYKELSEILEYEKNNGRIVWVLGPAFSFDAGAREAMSWMIDNRYVHCILAGNALATHDLEGAFLHTALGQDIYTQESVKNGHYNHLDVINRIRDCGGIEKFINNEKISDGIIYSCVKNNVPFVLTGSIRDDGPLPEVIGNAYEAQDAMRNRLREATCVISMATMLHSIATGNMTPSYRVRSDGTVRQVYFYCVDISEFVVNKLSDRGSLSSRGIVTNARDFIVNIRKELEK